LREYTFAALKPKKSRFFLNPTILLADYGEL